ncbi:unnamed protein product [Moneuplotes crassus]|uniref:Uncharacterized protein n=1 Tax=Euplotes crassus TaxID=5936 RepID=A0AAD1UI96_EUPCR|nr:unnamed protein product [Moneuplotes crassus]
MDSHSDNEQVQTSLVQKVTHQNNELKEHSEQPQDHQEVAKSEDIEDKSVQREQQEQREEEKSEHKPENPLDDNDSEDVSPKKVVKIPKNNAPVKKEISPKEFSLTKNFRMKNIYNSSNHSPNSRYRKMKSMDKTSKKFRSSLVSSIGKMSATSSQGFRSNYNTRQNKRRNLPDGNRSLMTLQRAGPGSYDLPPLLGGFILQNNKRNNPRYTIGKASKYEIQSMTKEQLIRNPGAESPGVGSYSPDHAKVRCDSPRAKIGRERRFIQLKSTNTLKKKVPHAYLSQDMQGLGYRKNGRGFTKEKRFILVAMKSRDSKMNPAPSHYNHHLHNTISSTFGNYKDNNRNATTKISQEDKYHNRTYFKELERCYGNDTSPGPAAYDSHKVTTSLSNMRRAHHNSFTKSGRNMMPRRKGDTNEPSPATYRAHLIKNSIKGGSFGTSRKGIDFTQLHAQHRGLIQKGLV